MSKAADTFGRRLLRVASIDDSLTLEAEAGRETGLAPVDVLLGDLLVAAAQGVKVVSLTNDVKGASASLPSLTSEDRSVLDKLFSVAEQERRGAWYLPDSVSLKAGSINLAAHFGQHPRFAMGIASDDRAKVTLRSSADAVCIWASLEPFFDALWRPLELRGPLAGTLGAAEFSENWREVEKFLAAIDLRGGQELSRLAAGNGWHTLTVDEQLERKSTLIASLSAQCSTNTARRFRLYRIRDLVDRYYAKANANGQAERRKVLTKAFQPILSGYFAGDWLALLDYLGEVPHPNEQIATTLPEPRLYVTGAAKVEDVAAAAKLPLAEVERMIAAFWHQTSAQASPIEERVQALRRFWLAFDEIHARQRPGDRPLWGLVEERGAFDPTGTNEGPYVRGLYRTLLPGEVISAIDRLWSGVTWPATPERVVTEIWPHALMADSFGPALKFWHGCALTAWFIAEGPTSRTDMAGLEHYHRRDLSELEALGCPVDHTLFRQLIEVESKLGPSQPIEREQSRSELVGGLSISMKLSVGSRRGGFAKMRDVITQQRRRWAENYLDAYLKTRWERELKAVADAYSRWLLDKGRQPSLKQFARIAAPAANRWFGGELGGLYAAIGEKTPGGQTRHTILPSDRLRFVRAVFQCLGGQLVDRSVVVENPDEANIQTGQLQRQHVLSQLASFSLEFLQFQESLGREPDLPDFGESRFNYYAELSGESQADLWVRYRQAIRDAREMPASSMTEVRSGPEKSARPEEAPPAPLSSDATASIDHSRAPAEVVEPRPVETPKPKNWLQRILGG